LGFVSLKVYDVPDKEVRTLVNENKPDGYYEVESDSSDLPGRIYYYKPGAVNISEVCKIILL